MQSSDRADDRMTDIDVAFAQLRSLLPVENSQMSDSTPCSLCASCGEALRVACDDTFSMRQADSPQGPQPAQQAAEERQLPDDPPIVHGLLCPVCE